MIIMSKNIYFILTFLGFLWGIFGGYIIADSPYLFLGWIPISVVSIVLTGFYASIINYLENHDYIFLNVLLNNEGERIPEVYYWIISKNLQEEVIIKIDGGISAESYLFNTQYLSNDNKLYCLGYIWENKDMESFEENLNPSVVALEFNELFSKVR